MKTTDNKRYFRKSKLIFNTLIILFTVATVHGCCSAVDDLFNARPSIYKKYFLNDNEKAILSRVNMNSDTPIILYDQSDKWHPVYSVYQNDKLIFKCKYPSDDEQEVIDIFLKSYNLKAIIFFSLFLICIIIRIILIFMTNNLIKIDNKKDIAITD